MKKIFLALFLSLSIVAPQQVAAAWSDLVIVLDPGHGGDDPGACYASSSVNNYTESWLVLQCAGNVYNTLSALGANVYMTRFEDDFSGEVDLSPRRAFCYTYGSDVFVSFHLNAANASAHGTETYYSADYSSNSYSLAYVMQTALIDRFSTVNGSGGYELIDRGVKSANYTVITAGESYPSILTESLFIDCWSDWQLIQDVTSTGFYTWVDAHLQGIYNYVTAYEGYSVTEPTYFTGGGGGSSSSETPYIDVSSNEVTLTCEAGQSVSTEVTVKGNKLNGWCFITVEDPDGVFSVSPTGLTVDGEPNYTFVDGEPVVTITFSPKVAGNYPADIDLSNTWNERFITFKSVDVNGNDVYQWIALNGVATEPAAKTPTITTSTQNVSLSAVVGESASKTITVNGSALEGNITLALSGKDANLFKLSQTSIAKTSASTNVTITYTPSAVANHSATLTLTSKNAPTVTIPISGTGKNNVVINGYEMTQDWAQTENHIAVASAGRCWGTGFDGKIYFNDYNNSKLYYWSESGLTDAGTSTAGTAITNDDAGNIILSTSVWSSAPTALKILPAGSTTYQDLTITLPTGVSANSMMYMGKAIGDVMSEEGGAIYLIPNLATAVAKVIIKNGVQASASVIDVSSVITADAATIATPLTSDINSDLIAVKDRDTRHFYHNMNDAFEAFPDNGTTTTQGGTIFNLAGKLFVVETIGSSYCDGFQVVDVEKNAIVASHTEVNATAAYKPNPNIITAEVVSDFEAKLYQYVPGQYASQYTFKVNATVGVENIVEAKSEMSIAVAGQDLYINGIEVADVEIYSIAGTLVAKEANANVNISALASGIYIVKATDVNGYIYTAKISFK